MLSLLYSVLSVAWVSSSLPGMRGPMDSRLRGNDGLMVIAHIDFAGDGGRDEGGAVFLQPFGGLIYLLDEYFDLLCLLV